MKCQQKRQHSNADSKTAAKPENTVSTQLLTLLMTSVAFSFQYVTKKSSNSFRREKREERERISVKEGLPLFHASADDRGLIQGEKRGCDGLETNKYKRAFWSPVRPSRPAVQKLSSPRIDSWSAIW